MLNFASVMWRLYLGPCLIAAGLICLFDKNWFAVVLLITGPLTLMGAWREFTADPDPQPTERPTEPHQ